MEFLKKEHHTKYPTVLFYYAVERFGKVILEKEIDNAISNKLNQIMMKTKKKG